MRTRGLQILLLTSFLYWATGLGQCLHERIEHHIGMPINTTVHAAGQKPLPAQPPKEPDDRDDCVTCQALKAMVAHSTPPIALPQPTLPNIEKQPIVHRQAPVIRFVVFLPARAPPIDSLPTLM
jgi:hypothetical protein